MRRVLGGLKKSSLDGSRKKNPEGSKALGFKVRQFPAVTSVRRSRGLLEGSEEGVEVLAASLSA